MWTHRDCDIIYKTCSSQTNSRHRGGSWVPSPSPCWGAIGIWRLLEEEESALMAWHLIYWHSLGQPSYPRVTEQHELDSMAWEREEERERKQSSVRRKVEAELEGCEMDVKLINIHWVKFSKNKKTIIMKPPEHFMFMDFQANRICSRLLSVWQWTARAAVSPGFALLFKSMCLSACARLRFLCSNVGFVSLGSGLRDNEGSQLQHPCH